MSKAKKSMKKRVMFGVIGLVLGILILFGLSWSFGTITGNAPGGKTCTDTDGGMSYFVQGKVIVCGRVASTCKSYADSCNSSTDLIEVYCNNKTNDVARTRYTCPNGCSKGRCLPMIINGTTNCFNDCSPSGLTECVGLNSYRSCGNYDNDSCLEWNGTSVCMPSYVCQNGSCVVNQTG